MTVQSTWNLEDPDVVSAIDELPLWSAPFGQVLLDTILLKPGLRVLDIGSGLGGPARTLAETYGCHVTGIDLTASFCAAATAMSEWVGLTDKVTFAQGDS